MTSLYRNPLGSAAGAGLEGSELTPLVVDGVLYATAADRVVALRADTGAEAWRFALPQSAPSQRGLAFWPGDAAAPVLRSSDEARLTLTTCWPIRYLGTAPERLLVTAKPLQAAGMAKTPSFATRGTT